AHRRADAPGSRHRRRQRPHPGAAALRGLGHARRRRGVARRAGRAGATACRRRGYPAMTPATPVVLLVLALALTGPGPAALARARWPLRAPRAALVFWQAMALSALLAALGAGLSAATLVLVYQDPHPVVVALHSAALLLTLVVVARLLWSAHTLGTALRAGRRRQRHLVDL